MKKQRKTQESANRGDRGRKQRPRSTSGGAQRKTQTPQKPDLPPNENLQKHPDEAYGDTQIPERKTSD